jgi:hypothetical protein
LKAEFIAPSDPRWRAFVARVPHDVYHLPEYVVAASRAEKGRPGAFYAESENTACLIPLLIRDLPEELGASREWYDAASPYGYPGLLATNPTDEVALIRFLTALRELGDAQGLVSAFIRLHPLLPLPSAALRSLGSVRTHGRVVHLDLTQSTEKLWSEARKNHGRGIRKLHRAGFVATMDDWGLYPEFIRLYKETMRRVAAAPFYFFARTYFEDVRAELLGQTHLCTVAAPDGRIACAGLFFEEAGIVQYHLSGTADEFLGVAPSKLMFDCVFRWSKERGNHVLHLGGGLGGREDSLFHFKAGFSPLRAEFQSLHVVFNQDRYRTLTSQIDGAAAISPEFFPLYRAPKLGTPP